MKGILVQATSRPRAVFACPGTALSIFSLPEKSFTLINDENGEIYLAKIDKFTIQKFPSKKQNSEDYKNFANEKLSKSLYQIYDNYLNVKYDIKINYKTIERVKSFFN